MFEELVQARIDEETKKPVDWFPTLYKQDKHKGIRVWAVWTEGDEIVTSFGTLGGQEQVARKKAEPKNVGQKNETTGPEQALSEAASMHSKQQDKGYRLSVEEAKKYILLPMLAQKFEDKKNKIKYPVYVQPKLDGVRCLAYWGEDGIELMSRKGKPYNVPHIKEQLESVLPIGRVFDGELYLHGATFQEVTRLVKKLRPETKTIDYCIYDSFEFDGEDTPCRERLAYLSSLDEVLLLNPQENIKVVTTGETDNEKGVYDYQQMYVAQGFEGAIVRCPEAPYEVGHRSNFLLKVKSFMDNEYKIVDFNEGVGKNVGCVTWKCQIEDGKVFNVVPKGTYEQKKKWFSEASSHVGKWLTVKFFELSEDGVPRFPVGLGIRMEEDLPDGE